MDIKELAMIGTLTIVAVLAASCFMTFLEVAWEQVFGRGR